MEIVFLIFNACKSISLSNHNHSLRNIYTAMPLQDSVSFFLSQCIPPNHKSADVVGTASSQKDETETLGMESSDDGIGIDEDEFGYMTKHPSKQRQKETNQISLCILVTFCLLMVGLIVPLSRRQQRTHAVTMNTTAINDKPKSGQSGESTSKTGASTQTTQVYCNGEGTISMDDWFHQNFEFTTTAELCDPEVSQPKKQQ